MSGGELTDASGLIDPDRFPARSGSLGIKWAEDQARYVRAAGREVIRAIEGVHSAWGGLPEHYQAPEAQTLYRVLDPVLGEARREQETYDDAASYLREYADDLGAVKQSLANLELEAAAFRSQVAAGVWVTPAEIALGVVLPDFRAGGTSWTTTGGVGLVPEGRWVEWSLHRPSVDRNQQLVAQARGVFEQIETAEKRCADRLRSLDSIVAPGLSPTGPYATPRQATAWADIAEFAPTQAVLDGGADDVREWWDTLTPEQRRALVSAIPSLIGNLNGVPVKFRAEANRANLAAEIERLRGEEARIEKELSIAATASRFGRGLYVPDLRLAAELDRVQAAIVSYEQYLELQTPREQYDEHGLPVDPPRTSVEVVAFDPLTSTIATYHGPYDENGDVPDWVENVAVHVPGTTTRMDDFNGTDLRASQLYDAANRIKDAGQTAVFAWAGGQFPQGVDAAGANYSRDLGSKLRDFVDAVDVHPDSTLTVTGHSYGGAVVGVAESEGLRADRILYMAGAGLGNDNTSVEDFPHTKHVPHYAMMARNDAVVGYIQDADAGEAGHGASPLDDPRITRLETGFIDADRTEAGDIESLGGATAHSGIYTPGSTAFNNVVGVITGTGVEAYAPDLLVRTGPGRSITETDVEAYGWGRLANPVIDGIDRPGYEPDTFNITDRETDQVHATGPNQQEPR